MATPKERPQMSMNDKTIEDPELLEQIAIFMETKEEAKTHRQAKAQIEMLIAARFPEGTLDDGDVIRVGSYTIPMKSRAGGGFEVPTWEKVTIGKITEAQ